MTLKQKVRKYNKDFEAEIQSFRENPVNSDEEQAEQGVPSNTTLHILYIVLVVQLQRKHALNIHYTTTTVGPIPVLVRKSLSLDLKTRAILRNCSFELENCPRIVSRHVYLAPLGRWP